MYNSIYDPTRLLESPKNSTEEFSPAKQQYDTATTQYQQDSPELSEGEAVYTSSEASRYLDRSQTWLYDKVKQGALKRYRKNGQWFYLKGDIHVLKETLPVFPSTPAKLSESETISTVIGTVFAALPNGGTLKEMREVTPSIRVWHVAMQTKEGAVTYRVVYEDGRFLIEEKV